MSFPKKAYRLISAEEPDPYPSVEDISMYKTPILLSPIMVYACVRCGDHQAWSRTMYRQVGGKPYTSQRCYGCDMHCWGEKGKWMLPDEAQAIWAKQYETDEPDELSHLEPKGDN